MSLVSLVAPRCALRISALAIAACIAMASPPAAAFNKRVEKACKGDYQKLCPSYKTESTQLRACMEAKANEISPSCIQALLDSGEVDKKRVSRR